MMSQDEYRLYLKNKLNWKSSRHSKVFKYGSRSNMAAEGSQVPIATYFSFVPNESNDQMVSPRQSIDNQTYTQVTQMTYAAKKTSNSGNMYIEARGSSKNLNNGSMNFRQEDDEIKDSVRRKIELGQAKANKGGVSVIGGIFSGQPMVLRDEDKVPQTFLKHLNSQIEADKLSPEL